MSAKDSFDKYLLALRKTPLDDKTEHSDRGALQILLQALADDVATDLTVHHETKQAKVKSKNETVAAEKKAAPDFKVTKGGGLILGYVENKAIGEPLDKVLKSEQIAKYKTLSQNIVLTDYLHFIWINKDGIQRETLCHVTDLENRKFKLPQDRVEAVTKLLQGFFSTAPEGIGRSQPLALALARRSQLLRDFLAQELIRQEKENRGERLYGLFEIFKEQVFHELTLKEFADAFAQMLAYGLFLARLNSGDETITLQNARQFVPGSFRLIRELVDFLNELDKDEYRAVRWVVEEVLSIVNGLNLPSIHEDLSFRQRKAVSRKVRAGDEDEHRLFERDPFIYFYEDYLKAYDKEMREARGVYYTPPPIVNFIVRAVDDILKDSFGIKDGLADHKRVTVLDFACGTGTFLLEIFQRIFDNIGGPESGKAASVVRGHMLKNVFGFEYLIAPYTIAHLKLAQYLRDKEHPLEESERLQIFLTNTLEPVEPIVNRLLPELTAETKAAQAVKEKPVLVITGNPPYSGHSKNKGKWISESIDEYKFIWGKTAAGLDERKPLGEKNSKWLNDDYVKFMRFAQMKMDGFTFKTIGTDGKAIEHSVSGVESGIVGIITNHSWLDNPTFRGMRQSLMRSFDQIYILDLHGSTKPKELVPPGVENANVFDIQKGVAITLLVKKSGASRGIWYSDFWGTRLEKYKLAFNSQFKGVAWQAISSISPYYILRPLDLTHWDKYQSGWSLADSLNPPNEKTQIFDLNVLGFQSHRDHFALDMDRFAIEKRASDMIATDLSDHDFSEKYEVKSNRDWKVSNARTRLRMLAHWRSKVIPASYRPFDNRFCFFGPEFMDYPRRELIDHVAGKDNLALVASRQIGTSDWRHAFIADGPANDCLVSDQSSEASQVFPLWRYSSQGKSRQGNFSPSFRKFIDDRYEDHHYSPEEILGYIYAILHAPSYRTRYAEFLRIDFPRIPFPKDADDFEALSRLGWALVQAHLLRELPRRKLAQYHGKGDNTVEAARYSPEEQSIAISKTQSFKPVPEDVWNFHIGGYQVLDKYLKSRKGRKLSLDEIDHVAAIADSLTFTIAQMVAIDKIYCRAFDSGDN